MATRRHLALIKRAGHLGEVDVWNKWREEHPTLVPNLSSADLDEAILSRANLSGANLTSADLITANLSRANLTSADLITANLSRANLTSADLSGADFNGVNLSGAELNGAKFSEANLTEADLSRADLSGANLNRATLVETNFSNANLDGCFIYGISAWGVNLEETIQSNLIITPPGEPSITIDNLKVAQFVYLILNNTDIRDVIDTITSKVVLILGRFTPERKGVLNALRESLRRRNYSPVMFDFDKSRS
jgi:pentapeptide repeat protein